MSSNKSLMKKNFNFNNFILLLFLSILFFSCQKESKVDKIVVYEKFTACECDTTIKNEYRNECKIAISERMIVKDLIGYILPKSNPLDRLDNIEFDQNQVFSADSKNFPKWPPSPLIVSVCNLPNDLSKSAEKIKVKIDLNIFYEGISIGIPKPQSANYYPVELLRLEIINY